MGRNKRTLLSAEGSASMRDWDRTVSFCQKDKLYSLDNLTKCQSKQKIGLLFLKKNFGKLQEVLEFQNKFCKILNNFSMGVNGASVSPKFVFLTEFRKILTKLFGQTEVPFTFIEKSRKSSPKFSSKFLFKFYAKKINKNLIKMLWGALLWRICNQNSQNSLTFKIGLLTKKLSETSKFLSRNEN